MRRGSNFEETRSVAGVNWIDGTSNTKPEGDLRLNPNLEYRW